MKNKDLNTFKREYFDLSKRLIRNAIIHDSNASAPHRILLCSICEWLRDNGFVFYTRVYMKHGEIIDIVVPELPNPFLEIRHSEKEKKKEYNSEFDDKRIFIDTDDPFRLL